MSAFWAKMDIVQCLTLGEFKPLVNLNKDR